MASSATNFLLLLVALSSTVHTHARDSQSFNKIPSTTTSTTTNDVKITHNPNTKNPENENVYGLYGHESSQLPPPTTTTTTANGEIAATKYRPKNYNPVAYVTEPEDMTTFTAKSYTKVDPNNYGGENFKGKPEGLSKTRFTGGATPNHRENYYRNGGGNYYNSPQEDDMRGYRRNNYYNNGGGSFNDQTQGLSESRFMGGASSNHRENYYRNSGDLNSFQQQGMSDTRYLENGKYFYDVNSEKYSSNHPYESLRDIRARNEYRSRNYYGNNENSYEYNNSMEEFQNRDEFQENQDEENMP